MRNKIIYILVVAISGLSFLSMKMLQNVQNNDNKCNRYMNYLKEKNISPSINVFYNYLVPSTEFESLPVESEIYKNISDGLGLDKPSVELIGYNYMDSILLLKVSAEDVFHDGFYLMLIDNSNCNILDYLYLERALTSETLELLDDREIGWIYKADFKMDKNRVVSTATSIDVADYNNGNVDTLYKKEIRIAYIYDLKNGFKEICRDSIEYGTQY